MGFEDLTTWLAEDRRVQDSDFWNQIVLACNERTAAVGDGVIYDANDGLQTRHFSGPGTWRIYSVMKRLDSAITRYVRHLDSSGTPRSPDFIIGLPKNAIPADYYWTKDAFYYHALGDSGGFRRYVTPPYYDDNDGDGDDSDSDDDVLERGLPEKGDIIGPWMLEDILAVMKMMKWTASYSFAIGEGRYVVKTYPWPNDYGTMEADLLSELAATPLTYSAQAEEYNRITLNASGIWTYSGAVFQRWGRAGIEAPWPAYFPDINPTCHLANAYTDNYPTNILAHAENVILELSVKPFQDLTQDTVVPAYFYDADVILGRDPETHQPAPPWFHSQFGGSYSYSFGNNYPCNIIEWDVPGGFSIQ